MDYSSEIKEIQNSKPKIAMALALGIFNGSERKALEVYPGFLADLEATSVFFLEVKSFDTTYTLGRKKAINALADYCGYEVLPFIDKKATMKVKPFFDHETPEFIAFYTKNGNK